MGADVNRVALALRPVSKEQRHIMRRYGSHMLGEPYLGNTKTREVHDLDNETDACRISHIVTTSTDRPFVTLEAAHDEGYKDCPHCFPRTPSAQSNATTSIASFT